MKRRHGAPAAMALALVLAGCRAEPAPESAVEAGEAAGTFPIDLASARLVDLSHSYDDQALFWPTSPSAFELEQLAWGETEGGFFYSANRFCTPEHGGTHLNAPIHFARDRWTTADIPLERLSGPAAYSI